MQKRIISALLVALVCSLFMSSSLLAKAGYDKRVETAQTSKVVQYSFPQAQRELIARTVPTEDTEEQIATAAAERKAVKVSLGSRQGSSNAAASAGFTIATTWMDDQQRPDSKGHQIDFRNQADIIFTYTDAPSPSADARFAYNAFNPSPVNGNFNCLFGYGSGAVLQASGEKGSWPKLDVVNGRMVLAGVDDVGQPLDNHIYDESAWQSGFFGGGSSIPSADYSTCFYDAGDKLFHPVVEVQQLGPDVITHILGGESVVNTFGSLVKSQLVYFRRVNAGAWTGKLCVDDFARVFGGSMTASRVSNKVAVSWTKVSTTGVANSQIYDNNTWIRVGVSTLGSTAWGPNTNITNYSRVTASGSSGFETHCLYDTGDNLHVIWASQPTIANVYAPTSTFFWGDFSNLLMHWYSATGNISVFHNSDWGLAQNTQVCGFGSPGTAYTGFFSISECDNKLYVVFTQYLNFFGNYGQLSQTDDCASGGFDSRVHAANGEVLMVVSGDLSGLLWDAARNLSGSYTPNCDSATGGGVCMNDTRATMSRYGQNTAGMCWPGPEKVDPSGSYAGDWYLHILYTEDHFPSPAWRTPAFGPLTENPLKWMRLACVQPIVAAQIFTTPTTLGYPEYVTSAAGPSQTDVVPVTVRNDGNANLVISAITPVKLTQPGFNWLTVSQPTLTVPAGLSNTGTFNITISGAGFPANSLQALNGYVILTSNAANSPADTIVINYVVADTVAAIQWDTVTTSNGNVASATGRIALIVSNHGESGRSGIGRVNLDYAANGIAVECDTTRATVYLYSGSPVVIRRDSPTVYSMTASIFQANFGTAVAFKPVHNRAIPAKLNTVAYDGYFTGTFVSEDTSIAVERTYFAPKSGGDNADFIIICTKFYSYNGITQNNLLLGDMIDWDVPSNPGATNKTGIEGSTVFARGSDTGTVLSCFSKARYGASTFLGMHTEVAFNANPCANDVSKHGQYADRNDSVVFPADNGVADPARLWTKAGAISGTAALAPAQDSTDVNIMTTYKHNYTLAGNDTLTVYTAVTSVRAGVQDDLKANFTAACNWYNSNLRPGCTVCSCCIGSTGNADGSLDDVVDIGDLT
ncbi:MAG: hypothetical protein SGI97_02475, partial [candidate division Zixibacteria bacterium]|nr:hypothetical protein [candidate division Zixibacteria bacterium]